MTRWTLAKVRIGASLYFANSAFIKETVMSYVDDLEDPPLFAVRALVVCQVLRLLL